MVFWSYLRGENQPPSAFVEVVETRLRSMLRPIIGQIQVDRFPRAIPVDEAWYLAEYPDVQEAVSGGSFTSARQHFEREGFKEGRLPSEGWSLSATGRW